MGAIYLEKGLGVVEKSILDLWQNHIKRSVITQIDAKTKLQEFALKNFKNHPTYKLIANTGPRHKPSFKVGVKLPNAIRAYLDPSPIPNHITTNGSSAILGIGKIAAMTGTKPERM